MNCYSKFSIALTLTLSVSASALAASVSDYSNIPTDIVGVTSGDYSGEASVYNSCGKNLWIAYMETKSPPCGISSCEPTSFTLSGWYNIPPDSKRNFTSSSGRLAFFVTTDESDYNVISAYDNLQPGAEACISTNSFLKTTTRYPFQCELNDLYYFAKSNVIFISDC